MKPRPFDRVLMIILCLDLVLAFWCIYQSFPAHAQVMSKVF